MRYLILLVAIVSFPAFAQDFVDFDTFRKQATDPAFRSLSVTDQFKVYQEVTSQRQIINDDKLRASGKPVDDAKHNEAERTLDQIRTQEQLATMQRKIDDMQNQIDRMKAIYPVGR